MSQSCANAGRPLRVLYLEYHTKKKRPSKRMVSDCRKSPSPPPGGGWPRRGRERNAGINLNICKAKQTCSEAGHRIQPRSRSSHFLSSNVAARIPLQSRFARQLLPGRSDWMLPNQRVLCQTETIQKDGLSFWCRLSINPKPPLRGEVARHSRVGGVGAKSLECAGNHVHFPTSNRPPLSRLRRQLPSEGSLEATSLTH